MAIKSNEFYRALARLVLDIRYKERVENAINNINNILKDGGFNLSQDEISTIGEIISDNIDIEGIIGIINGKKQNIHFVKGDETNNELQNGKKLMTYLYDASYVQVKPVDVVPK